MAQTLTATRDNTIALFATLPSNNVGNNVILDLQGQYDKDDSTLILEFTSKGVWLTGVITAADVPPRDDFYDLEVYATSSGDVIWASELRDWADITETWEDLIGILRGNLISREVLKVENNENFTTPEYLSSNEIETSNEYISDSEDISDDAYVSSTEDESTQEYQSSTETPSPNEYESSNDDAKSKSYY